MCVQLMHEKQDNYLIILGNLVTAALSRDIPGRFLKIPDSASSTSFFFGWLHLPYTDPFNASISSFRQIQQVTTAVFK